MSKAQPAELGFRAVLANLAHTIEANWQGALDDTDTEFLHELRVAVRQTRTVLGQAKGVLPEAERQRFADGFRFLAGLTSTPRDLDVLLLNWPGYMAALDSGAASGASLTASCTALEPLHDKLVRERRRARRAFVTAMKSKPTRALISSWNLWLATPPADAGRLGTTGLRPVVAANITSAHRRLVHHGRRIDDHSVPEALHDLRKDAKRLRYQIECFAGLLPRRATARYVRRLKQLQDNLGEYQDVAVQCEALRVALATMELGPAFTQLTTHLETRRLCARAAFAGQFADFDTPKIKRDLAAMTKRLTVRPR